jgi:hypothetical protein
MLGIEYSPCYHCDKTKCSFCELTRYKDSQQKKEASEMRLIDAYALMRDIGETVLFSGKPNMVSAESRGARKVVDRIAAAPTLDAVEIVRCRECQHRIEGTKMCAHPKAIGWDAIEPDDDDFCSYGERRENEQTRENA